MQRRVIGPQRRSVGPAAPASATTAAWGRQPPSQHQQHHQQPPSQAAKASGGGILASSLRWRPPTPARARQWADTALHQCLQGLYDSLALTRTLDFFLHSTVVRESSLNSLALNGALLLGSHYTYHKGLAPLIAGMGRWLFAPFGEVDRPPPHLEAVVGGGSYLIYQALWMLPIFLLAFVVSLGLNDGVAEAGYLHDQAAKRASAELPRLVSDLVARVITLYALLLQVTCLGGIASLLPPVPGWAVRAAALLLTCWLDGFYAFQYVWARKGVPVDRQTARIEAQWPYFLGFGLLPACVTSLLPFFVGVGAYAMVFPLYILLALRASPPPYTNTAIEPQQQQQQHQQQPAAAQALPKQDDEKGGGGNGDGTLGLGRAPVFWFARRVERAAIQHLSSFLLDPSGDTPLARGARGLRG